MEIINKPQGGSVKPSAYAPRIYVGAVLIAVGVVWMLHNFDVIGHRVFDLFFSWQMLLVVIGGYFLAIRKWAAGGIITGIGVFFMATDLLELCIPFDKVALPIIFIAAGLALLLSWKR